MYNLLTNDGRINTVNVLSAMLEDHLVVIFIYTKRMNIQTAYQ